MYRPRFSIRVQLTLAIVAVIIFVTALLGAVGYNLSRRALDDYARRTVTSSAESGSHQLSELIATHSRQTASLIEKIELACGAGSVNSICARQALSEGLHADRADAAHLTIDRKRVIQIGRSSLLRDIREGQRVDTTSNHYFVSVHNPHSGWTLVEAFPTTELLNELAGDRKSVV